MVYLLECFQQQINPHLVALWVFVAAGRCVWDWVKINYNVCVFAVIKELIVAHWCVFNRRTSGLLHLLQVLSCTRHKIQFVLSFSFSSYFSSFLILMPNACNTQFAAAATGFNFCDPGGSILSMHAHIQQQPDSYSVSFSYFFDWEQPNTSKQSSVTVPAGSSTAAAGDKLFGSRALRPLLLFNLVRGIQLVTHIRSAELKQMLKADQIGVFSRLLQTEREKEERKRKKIKTLKFNLLWCRLQPHAEWYEDIMRNCLHDYPIKRLIHNLTQLKGGDCYSVFHPSLSLPHDHWWLQ